MRKLRIIPRLDIKGENLIKGIQLGCQVIGNPNIFAKYYHNGADELYIWMLWLVCMVVII